jgi:ketosteroid isomerase-like protein
MLTGGSEFIVAARTLDAAFVRHASAGEIDLLVASCYAEDALVLPPNLPLVRGFGQIRELFRDLLEAGAGDVARETTPLHVAGDLGYGAGRFTFAIHHPRRELVHVVGKHLVVYRRQVDGVWKVAADMFSSDLPEP